MPVYWHYLLHIGPLNLGIFNRGLLETRIEPRLDFIQQEQTLICVVLTLAEVSKGTFLLNPLTHQLKT